MSRLCISSPREWLVLVLHQTDENGSQQRKDIGLEKRDQQLKTQHEQHKQHRPARDDPVREHEDQAHKRQDHEVPGGHIREQPQAERKRLHDFPDQLHRGHDERHGHGSQPRHAGRNHDDRLEIAFGSECAEARNLDRQEGDDRERSRDREVAGRRRAPGKQAKQVAVENEEKERQDERGEFLAAVTDARDHNIVPHKQHQGLDRPSEPARRPAGRVPSRHLAATVPDRDKDEERGDHHENEVLGRREVRPADHPPVREMPFAEPERQLDHAAVGRVLENDLADVGGLDHLRNLVSRNKSGNSTPTYASRDGMVRETIRTTPTPSNRIAMPPSQRAMNSGLGARIFGRSSATDQSCAITATPPPIAAGFAPTSAPTTTNPTTSAAGKPKTFIFAPPLPPSTASYRPLPSMSFFPR